MKTQVKITCPYCKTGNTTMAKIRLYEQSKIVRCDSEYGGCHQEYVIKFKPQPVLVESYSILNLDENRD